MKPHLLVSPATLQPATSPSLSDTSCAEIDHTFFAPHQGVREKSHDGLFAYVSVIWVNVAWDIGASVVLLLIAM